MGRTHTISYRCPSASSGVTAGSLKTRARVEHVFAAMAQMGGKLIRTIGQTRASFAMTMLAACYNLKRLVYLRRAAVVPF